MRKQRAKLAVATPAARAARAIAFNYFDPQMRHGDKRFYMLCHDIEEAFNKLMEAHDGKDNVQGPSAE